MVTARQGACFRKAGKHAPLAAGCQSIGRSAAALPLPCRRLRGPASAQTRFLRPPGLETEQRTPARCAAGCAPELGGYRDGKSLPPGSICHCLVSGKDQTSAVAPATAHPDGGPVWSRRQGSLPTWAGEGAYAVGDPLGTTGPPYPMTVPGVSVRDALGRRSGFSKARLDSARAEWLICGLVDGRIAQRESTRLTREGSQVQSLLRPPSPPSPKWSCWTER